MYETITLMIIFLNFKFIKKLLEEQETLPINFKFFNQNDSYFHFYSGLY